MGLTTRPRPEFISVVLPARNCADIIGTQLSALTRQEYGQGWELIIVDNASTDVTGDVVHRFTRDFPKARSVYAGPEAGVNVARNAGIAASRGDFVVFCDADDVVPEDWLLCMSEAAESFDIVSGAVLPFVGAPDAPRWLATMPFDPTGKPFLRYMPYGIGCNFGMWRYVVESVGPWDETYAGGADDVELSWRAQSAGFSLGSTDSTPVMYRQRDSLFALARQCFRYGNMTARLAVAYRDRGVDPTDWRRLLSLASLLTLRAYMLLGSRPQRRVWVRLVSNRVGWLCHSTRARRLCI